MQGSFCPYCVNQKLCKKEHCNMCFEHSFASHPRACEWDVILNGAVRPRDVALHSDKQYHFCCGDCGHDFVVALRDFACGFCANRKRCGDDACTHCAITCEVCLSKMARHVTRKSRVNCCRECLKDVIRRDPNETPLSIRSKITMEIYTLAELQSQAPKNHFLAFEPTTWDCPILPGLAFRPDCMWVFDNVGQVFVTCGACKIDLSQISYVLHLEVIENSRAQHSKERDIPDEEREQQIRELFNSHGINHGLVYATVAHTKHRVKPHDDDIFFAQTENGEYEVMEVRTSEWQRRLDTVRDALIELLETRQNRTILIGH
jgi:hypothetical protein